MKVKFIRPWRHFSPGQVIDDMPGGQADLMIQRGFIEEVKETEEQPKPKQNWKRK